jgi:predicted nuclease of predicted toxin-antitoxin system
LNPLFIDLYLDEDVNVVLADLLRARGFRVTTTRGAGQLGMTDEGQLAFAARQRKTILTHNRVHFEALSQRYYEVMKNHAESSLQSDVRPRN